MTSVIRRLGRRRTLSTTEMARLLVQAAQAGEIELDRPYDSQVALDAPRAALALDWARQIVAGRSVSIAAGEAPRYDHLGDWRYACDALFVPAACPPAIVAHGRRFARRVVRVTTEDRRP